MSKSKELLEIDFMMSKIPTDMSAEEAKKMHEEHKEWSPKFWADKFEALQKKFAGGAKAWEKSKSQRNVQKGILEGTILPHTTAKELQRMNEVHQKWPTAMLQERLEATRKEIERDQHRAKTDAKLYAKDLKFVKELRKATGEKLPWHLSPAAKQLKADMEAGKHNTMKPIDLYRSNPVYFENFPLEQFRKHIYQNRDAEPKRAYRFEKKKAKAKYPVLLEKHPRSMKQSTSST